MSDFILVLNAPVIPHPIIPNLMRYYDDITVQEIKFDRSRVYLSRSDDWTIWGPHETDEVLIALAGRIAVDSSIWEKARACANKGGLAGRIIYEFYKDGGLKLLENLNGNFVVILYEKHKGKLHIITDRCGMFPCYIHEIKEGEFIIGTHPDIMARLIPKKSWDKVSLTEYLVTGKVSYPNSYYNEIKAMEFGAVHTFDIRHEKVTYESYRKYFEFKYDINYKHSEWDLARELADAFRKALRRRTEPLFGKTGISLSGGLDSRALLCSVDHSENLCTFCFFDEENKEYNIARQIASSKGVQFIPLKRKFDHYGDYAESGVKISGGMGDFVNNHYLGFRKEFQSLGIDNIIAGFYCDYLFKSLVINKVKNKYLRTERFSDFSYSNYMPVFWFDTQYSVQVKERLDVLFPDTLKKDKTDYGLLEIEKRRLFPLYSEPDNMETLIPQRVLGWYLPIVDNDIINTYLKIRPNFKLNTAMYRKAVELLCGRRISKIENSNTGASVNANQASIVIHGFATALRSKLRRQKQSISTNESWPNWNYYVQSSKKIESLWMINKDSGAEFLSELIGYDPYSKTIEEYVKTDIKLFFRLLTLKIWSDEKQAG